MENMAKETVKAYLAITKKKPARKRKSISYTKSSKEVNHLSDPDYMKKPKKQTPTSFDMSEDFSTLLMYDKYSPYLVCVFNAIINHIKETIDKGTYREIEKLFLMKNRLVL
ncbi:8017_t:CDS:2 [Funneliformis caledonium]|uniref:8017_t:CDS:1 n=1 Tax=Funneliformis caledonium TaxID=1117310 RepID=A0A9N8WRC3_9GLOM|nr:8017_t:CDS:2 [Funneliformis caledonium]